jgi:hypothetical protein
MIKIVEKEQRCTIHLFCFIGDTQNGGSVADPILSNRQNCTECHRASLLFGACECARLVNLFVLQIA